MTAPPVRRSRLPGGGPLYRRPWEAVRPTHRVIAATVPTGLVTLVTLAAGTGEMRLFSVVPPLAVLALLAARPVLRDLAAGSGDAVVEYATGRRVAVAFTDRPSRRPTLWVDGRKVGTLRADSTAVPGPASYTSASVNRRDLTLSEERDEVHRVRRLRLDDPDGPVDGRRTEATAYRYGDRVDWVLDLDGMILRMRRRDGTRPERRTLLDPGTGRAWSVDADPDTGILAAQLPPDLRDEAAVFCLWVLLRLDGPPSRGAPAQASIPIVT